MDKEPLPLPPAVTGQGAGNRLAATWQQGNGRDRDDAFRQLFMLYFRSVSRFFARRGFASDECRDLTQDTFLKVHEGLGSFRGEARFETWLYRIAQNVYRNRLRAGAAVKARHAQETTLDGLVDVEAETGDRSVLQSAPPDATPEVLREMLSDEQSRLLRAALEQLPAQMRRCVVLRVQADLKYREIADTMGVSVDTVKSHLYQARQQLKRVPGRPLTR